MIPRLWELVRYGEGERGKIESYPILSSFYTINARYTWILLIIVRVVMGEKEKESGKERDHTSFYQVSIPSKSTLHQ